MKLVFREIKNEMIFEDDFQHLEDVNGTIEFKHISGAGGIAVVYAPNGTGKSSLAKVLSTSQATEEIRFIAEDDTGTTITPETSAFHVIPDQINRNVIPGTETDYLIGRQIRHEYELRDRINTAFKSAFSSLLNQYKTEFKVSKVGDFLLETIFRYTAEPYTTAGNYLRSIINIHSHGNSIDRDEFIRFLRNDENHLEAPTLDETKRQFIILNANSKNSIVKRIIELNCATVVQSRDTIQIEQHDDAIEILKKYESSDSCIVCDNHDYNGTSLLAHKTEDRERIYDGLDDSTKKLLDTVVKDKSLTSNDPFHIQQTVRDFIAGGESTCFQELRLDLIHYVNMICDEMIIILQHCFDGTTLFRDYDEFVELTTTNPELDSEELMFIEDVISQNIRRGITIERDEENRNYKLRLDGQDFLGKPRSELKLSSGEQNFISLAFELILARHSREEYVVLDDPISSFDSVYKNKIAFCIIKFLEDKKQIILTHNTDLVRLLHVQLQGCFNLYILNNTENGQNGFIPVSESEKNLLINLHELVKLFQNQNNALLPAIHNQHQFFMAMIPFMRGYVHIMLDGANYFAQLSNIMHGYNENSLDLVPVYNTLFGTVFTGSETISTDDILNIDFDSIDIIDDHQYPLLASTLKQTLIYYHLRMKVEKILVECFHVRAETETTTGKVISRAFPRQNDNDERNWKYRVFFNSRKTLLNEFNHFEGNMNIFQPALDINPMALREEINAINSKLEEVVLYASETQA